MNLVPSDLIEVLYLSDDKMVERRSGSSAEFLSVSQLLASRGARIMHHCNNRAHQKGPGEMCTQLLPSKSWRRPTPQLSATLQPKPVLDSAGVCSLVWSWCASHLSLWRLSSSTASWPCCFRLDGGRGLPCSSSRTCFTSSPIPLPRRFVDGLTHCVPLLVLKRWYPSAVSHIAGVDETAQHSFFTKSQLLHSFPDGRSFHEKKQ